MEQVLRSLTIIAEAKGTNEKVQILKRELTDPTFRKVVLYALDPRKQFNIKKLFPASPPIKSSNEKIFFVLDEISSKLGASDEMKQKLSNLCSSPIQREVVNRIVSKDLRCGVSSKLVNKAMPKLIPETPYQRCSSLSKKDRIFYPAYAQEKMDGAFVYINLKNGAMLSRDGSVFQFPENWILYDLQEKMDEDLWFVLIGEFLVSKDKFFIVPEERKVGNGILNKALKGTISKEDSKRIFVVLWDLIPLSVFHGEEKCVVDYYDRFLHLKQFVNDVDSPRVQLVPTKEVHSFNRAVEFAEELMNEGKEGAILKNFSARWKDGTSTDMIKIKAEKECELKITGWERGEKRGKFENGLGAFTCMSEDKRLTVNVGTGLVESFRLGDTKEFSDLIGKVVTVTFNQVICDKHGNYSLYLPRFKSSEKHPTSFVREDKLRANNLEEILEL